MDDGLGFRAWGAVGVWMVGSSLYMRLGSGLGPRGMEFRVHIMDSPTLFFFFLFFFFFNAPLLLTAWLVKFNMSRRPSALTALPLGRPFAFQELRPQPYIQPWHH